MNLVYIAFASTFVVTALSWHDQDESKLVGSWSDDSVRVSVYEEPTSDKWPHRLVLEKDGSTIRKWGRWEKGEFLGAAIGTMPNTISGEAVLVSVERPNGVLSCDQLVAHGVEPNRILNREIDFSK
jgi:hypothetical protein